MPKTRRVTDGVDLLTFPASPLLDLLSNDALQLIAAEVDEGDRLAFAQTCAAFCRAGRQLAYHMEKAAVQLSWQTNTGASNYT